MRKLNKLLAILMALSMILATACFASAESTYTQSAAPVHGGTSIRRAGGRSGHSDGAHSAGR